MEKSIQWKPGKHYSDYTGPESVEPPDDDDPEYNFLAEEETVDTEDFRDDKAVRVSSKWRNLSKDIKETSWFSSSVTDW